MDLLVVQDDVQQRAVHVQPIQSSVVFNEPHFAELVHEEADSGASYVITARGSDRVVFDFEREIPKCVKKLSDKDLPRLYDYVVELCALLRKSLSRAKRNRRNVHFPPDDQQEPPGGTIICIFFDGYYNGEPHRVSARFFHENQRLCKPQITPEPPYEILGSGSREVFRLLKTDDVRFAKYRIPNRNFANVNLVEAIQMAKNCILAQCDPEAGKVDETTCGAIGGHVHIATVTPDSGFQWVDGYAPLASS